MSADQPRTYVKRAENQDTEIPKEVRDSVYEILEQVREEGDEGVRALTRKFDEVDLDDLRVPESAIEAAADQLDADEREAIDYAIDRIEAFAEAQRETIDDDFEREFGEGIRCGQRTLPMDAAGTYVPGGNYTHISSIPMSVVPAKVAGVERVVTCTPPRPDGGTDPRQLYAMDRAGVDEIYTIGGAQAVGAMAYGTDSVDPVDIIAGPGNVFVVEAKRQVFGEVDLDLLPGPTEVLIVADETADPNLVALDLLSQAEHTATSRPVLISLDRDHAEAVLDEVEALLPELETEEIARECWERMGEVVLADDEDEAAALANDYAMEHLQVMTENPRDMLPKLRHYGGLFLGDEAPVTFGDKLTGPNHILPTHGTARFTGGCWVGTYLKTVTHQELTPTGAAELSEYAAEICEMEGMHGHQLSAERRPVGDD